MTYIDPVQVSPGHYKLLFENDDVRVLEMSLAAGGATRRIRIPLRRSAWRGGQARIHLPDGGPPKSICQTGM
jgi:hypothetical protein